MSPPRGTTLRGTLGRTPVPTGVGIAGRGFLQKGKTTWSTETTPVPAEVPPTGTVWVPCARVGTKWTSEFTGGVPAGIGGITNPSGLPYTRWTLEVKGVSAHDS
jgi:hypothetical protein